MRTSPLWDHVSSIALIDTGATVSRRRCRGWRLAPPGAPPCCVHVPLAGSRPLRWRTTMRIVFFSHLPLAGSRPLRWRTTMRIVFVSHVPLRDHAPCGGGRRCVFRSFRMSPCGITPLAVADDYAYFVVFQLSASLDVSLGTPGIAMGAGPWGRLAEDLFFP